MKSQLSDVLSAPNYLRYAIAQNSYIALVGGLPGTNGVFFVNPAACKMFGYTEEEFLTLNRFDIFEKNEDLINALKMRDRDGQVIAELKGIRKNGERFDCEVSSVFYSDEDGTVKSANTIIDITDRKKATEEVRKMNERYRLATQASFDAIWDADLVTKTVNWGDGFNTLFGYDPGEKQPGIDIWEDNIHEDDKERVLKHINAVIESKNEMYWHDEYRFYRRDRSIAYVVDRGTLIRDKNGIALRFVGAMRDVTSVRIKEEELREINNRFYYASQATADIIWDWDLVTDQILWADNFSKVLGYPLPPDSKLPVKFCINNFHPDDRERLNESLSAAIKNVNASKWEDVFRYKRADDTFAYLRDRGYIIRNKEGRAIRMIGAMQDISQAKYHEDILALELSAYEISTTQGNDLKSIVNKILSGIERIHPDLYTSVVLLDHNNTLKNLASPRLSPEYLQLTEGLQIGPFAGSCGTAMFRKEPVVVSDIETDPLWASCRDLIKPFGLKACWSIPIIHSDGKVLGSFAIYYTKPQKPSELEWNTIIKIRNLLRVLMENHFAMEQIQVWNERYNIISEATNDLVWDWNLETGQIYREEKGLRKVYGLYDNGPIDYIQNWLQRIHPDDREKVQYIIYEIQSSRDRNVFDIEYRFQRADGSYSYVYDRGVVIRDETGKPVRMIGAAQNITDRRVLEMQLFNKEVQKQKEVTRAIIDTQEKERADIGKELHDNVNQVLTTTKLYLDLAATDPAKMREFVSKSSDNIMYVINEIRKLSRSLMLPSLGDLGLLESVTDLTESINVTQKIHIDFVADPAVEDQLSDNQKLIIYRIIQEAMNNIIRHANACSVLIHLFHTQEMLQLIVSDDGKGFDKQQVRRGVGLKNIENRVYLFNGSLEINSFPGKGCELIIQVPLKTIKF